jgi:hypothetical protein
MNRISVDIESSGHLIFRILHVNSPKSVFSLLETKIWTKVGLKQIRWRQEQHRGMNSFRIKILSSRQALQKVLSRSLCRSSHQRCFTDSDDIAYPGGFRGSSGIRTGFRKPIVLTSRRNEDTDYNGPMIVFFR